MFLPTYAAHYGTAPSEPPPQSCAKRLWVEECGTERCCLRPRASAHLIIHRSKVTPDLSPCVFFLFHSRISFFFQAGKTIQRQIHESTSGHLPEVAKFLKVYEHPDAVTAKGVHYGFEMDSIYRWILGSFTLVSVWWDTEVKNRCCLCPEGEC